MRRLLAVPAMVFALPAAAADYPAPQQGDWVARDFRFHTGETMPALKLHYTTIGDPKNPAVLMLHGTTGSGAGLLKRAAVFYVVATSGGTLAYAKLALSRAAADKMLDTRLHAPWKADANDTLYQWESSGDYDPTPLLPRITARVLAINAADDECNPPETGLTKAAMKQVKDGRLYLIPASADTRGHGTTGNPKFCGKQLAEFLQALPAVR